jgi:hypothetical protein
VWGKEQQRAFDDTENCAKLIWEAHYSRMVGLAWRKLWSFFRNIFIGQDFDRTSTSILDLALLVPLPSQPSRSKAYTPFFLLPRILGNPSQWIICLAFCPPSKAMTAYLWSLIGFRRWPSSQPTRRTPQRQILPSSSSNECGSILGYHRPSSLTGTTGSSTHFGRVSSHCCTPSSLNTLLSTPKQTTKQRSSIR